MKNFIFVFVAFAIVACSRYPADVERALKLAGENRAELEKVLVHYRQRPEDKLKLRSAYFLIGNMPFHFTLHDRKLESFKDYLKKNDPHEGFMAGYKKTFGQVTGETEVKPDLYYITSEYLIRNIDFSFQIWNETPWGKYFSFDDFCEEILPYRLSNEPLEYWKEAYYDVFNPIIDSIASIQPDEVCMKLINHICEHEWNFEGEFQSQGFGALILLEKRYGNCKEIAEFVAYMLRSLGIPSGIDIMVQQPDKMAQTHFWNYTRDITGKRTTFEFYELYELFYGSVRRIKRLYGKVYRQCFELQKESAPVKYRDKYIPSGGLKNPLIRDVSAEYFPDTHISVHLQPGLLDKNDLAFLCVFNNRDWIPISCTNPKNGPAKFSHIEPDILYQIWYFDRTRRFALSKPFILNGNENAWFPDANKTDSQAMTLLRKYRLPTLWPNWVHRSVNGKFQGANQPDFSDAVTLHTIQTIADMKYTDIRPEHPGKFRYVRYLSAEGGYNNMAEVKFYADGKLLQGEVIGTNGAKEVFANSTKYAVFDNDPLTFFDAPQADGAWSGLKLDQAYHIDAIRYIFRNDDNNIRPGDTYELLYQSDGQWLSAGMQTADTTLLQYDKVPSNTLYWLRNHTRGKEERPFTYKDGIQLFW